MKIESNTYLKLFANCKPVKGAKRATICDLQREIYFLIPNSCYDFLQDNVHVPLAENLNRLSATDSKTAISYIDYIIENELGFLTKDPHLYPDIEFADLSPHLLNDMIIEFSPVINTHRDYLLEDITICGIQFLEIRIRLSDLKLFQEFLAALGNTRVRSIDIVCEYDNSLSISEIPNYVDNFSIIKSFILHSVPTETLGIYIQEKDSRQLFTGERLSNESCGQIGRQYFTSNLRFFINSLGSNNCLNKKVSIDKNGNYRNCPSLPNIYGNIHTTSLLDVIKNKEYVLYGSVRKDDVETCKDCEYRYICSDCRAHVTNIYDKPFYCNYNPYTNEYS